MDNNVKYVSQEHKDYCFRTFGGQNPMDYRPVVRTRMKNAWYKKGQILKVEMYGTCGAWDYKGRWVDYYDIGKALKYYPRYKRILFRITNFFLK